MKPFCLLACLMLASCSYRLPSEARTAMTGLPMTDLAGCAGKPDKAWQISSDDWIFQYEQSQPTQAPLTLKTTFIASTQLTIGAMGSCHAVIRLHKGYVASVHFTGPSMTMDGPNGACIPLIHECVTRRDHTSLPAGFKVEDWIK